MVWLRNKKIMVLLHTLYKKPGFNLMILASITMSHIAEHTGSVGRASDWGSNGLLSAESLCCVLLQDTLSAA